MSKWKITYYDQRDGKGVAVGSKTLTGPKKHAVSWAQAVVQFGRLNGGEVVKSALVKAVKPRRRANIPSSAAFTAFGNPGRMRNHHLRVGQVVTSASGRGTVIETIPPDTYRVRLDDGRELVADGRTLVKANPRRRNARRIGWQKPTASQKKYGVHLVGHTDTGDVYEIERTNERGTIYYTLFVRPGVGHFGEGVREQVVTRGTLALTKAYAEGNYAKMRGL